MANFTLKDLVEFTQTEKKMIEEVLHPDLYEKAQPSDNAVNNVLAYAKAVSIRPGKKLGHYSMILN